jgi:hypothetical protein
MRADIVVDAAQVDYQRNLFHSQFGYYPDAARQRELLDSYVREEMLHREALRLGLDTDDEIIRRRLVQKMEFLLTDATVVPEPTPAQLAAYQARHAARFERPARVSFEQRYFGDAPESRARALTALRKSAVRGNVTGEEFALGETFSGVEPDAALRAFGSSPLSRALFDAPVGVWSGPYRSGYGWHLVRVTARTGAVTPPLAGVRDAVKDAWVREFRERALQARFAELAQRYRVVRDDLPAAP